MTLLWHNRKARAFTLVEMLVVIAIIGVLAALLLPALTRGKQRAQRIACLGNLNELGTAFQMFAHDHRGKFPMQTPVAEGGSQEFVVAGTSINGIFYFSYRHLQTLANELAVPKILVCPADRDRESAFNFGVLQNSNVSYFVGAYADYNEPGSVLAGDRNITNDVNATASLVRGAYGLRWTTDLHYLKGDVLFADAHVEQLNNARVDLPGNAAVSTVLFLPAVQTSPITSPSFPSSPTYSSTTIAQNPYQPPAPRARNPGNADSNPPAPTPPSMPPRNGIASSTMASHQNSDDPTIIEAHARETNEVAVIGDAPPAAAPAVDEEEPPLLWLLGAARALVTKASWWLLLLLLLLLATALYIYSRRKMRERRER